MEREAVIHVEPGHQATPPMRVTTRGPPPVKSGSIWHHREGCYLADINTTIGSVLSGDEPCHVPEDMNLIQVEAVLVDFLDSPAMRSTGGANSASPPGSGGTDIVMAGNLRPVMGQHTPAVLVEIDLT